MFKNIYKIKKNPLNRVYWKTVNKIWLVLSIKFVNKSFFLFIYIIISAIPFPSFLVYNISYFILFWQIHVLCAVWIMLALMQSRFFIPESSFNYNRFRYVLIHHFYCCVYNNMPYLKNFTQKVALILHNILFKISLFA